MWKQKGEEYRVTGGQGWVWLRSTRRSNPAPQDTVGLRASAVKLRNRIAKSMNAESTTGITYNILFTVLLIVLCRNLRYKYNLLKSYLTLSGQDFLLYFITKN